MHIDVDVAIIVGVSIVDQLENATDQDELFKQADEVAGELGLQTWAASNEPDTAFDLFIGVVFKKRPTDKEVEEAKAKVTAALPVLQDKFGELSSGVEEWLSYFMS